MTNSTVFASVAPSLAADGWPVFPLVPRSKVPFAGSHGFKDATLNLEQIASWSRKWPDANVGVRPPWEDQRAVVVVDEDQRGHLATYLRNHDLTPAPATRTVTTRRGSHRYYLLPEPVTLRAGLDGVKVDLKSGRSGFVLAPGSVSASGKRYRLAADLPVAAVPADWLPHLTRKALAQPKARAEGDGPTPGRRMVRLLAVKRPGQGRRQAYRYFLGEAYRQHGGDPRLVAELTETAIRIGLPPSVVHDLADYMANEYDTKEATR